MVDEATPTPNSEAPVEQTALGAAEAEPVEAVADAAAEAPAADAAETPEAEQSADAGEAEGEADKSAEVPEAYELSLEGVELDPAMVETATPVFKELGLSNDQANKLMPVAQEFAKKIGDQHNQQILAAVAAERKAWLDTAKSDPEIGGQNFDANIVTAAKAMDQLGMAKGSTFRALLDDSGLGNHPEMIRAFVKIGKAIGEDTDFTRAGVATTGTRSHADILYPPKS